MVIDFHTHIFPEKIAASTIMYLEKKGRIKSCADGTLSGLQKSMKEAGIDLSVTLPVVTKPAQFYNVNEFAAAQIGTDGIIPFGGIHPNSEHYKEELRLILSMGLKGIKLHPDYQDTFINDKKYIRIIDYALELGLIVVVHAGLDIGYPEPYHCTPTLAQEVIQQLQFPKADNTLKLVFAHTGGYAFWDEVETVLVGTPVYFDISYSLGKIEEKQFLRIVRNHGANRILFATDSPWGGQKSMVTIFQNLPLTDEEKRKILYQNAKELLNEESVHELWHSTD